MATLVTRTTDQPDGTTAKGSELTHAEVDANFINLNTDKVEVSGAIVFAAKASEALTKGDVVYVSGVSGNTPTVSKADADDASKMPAFGLAETDANLNAAVNVVTFGTLYNLDTSSFTAGDTVYVSATAGSLTATKPAGESSLIQNMGRVIRSHASAGSIKVGGAGRSNDTPNLNNGNVFIGNASNQTEARALVEADISDLGTYLTAESDTLDTVTGRGATTTNDLGTGNLVLTKAGASIGTTTRYVNDYTTNGFYVGVRSNTTGDGFIYHGDAKNIEFWTSGTQRMVLDSSGDVGIGTTSPSTNLHIASTFPTFRLEDSDGGYGQINGGSGNLVFRCDAGNSVANSRTVFEIDGSEVMRIDSSGNVGIGTTSPDSALVVRGVAGSDSRIHISSGSAGQTSFDGSGSGLLLTATGMNTTSKFTPSVQFGTTDPSITTTNPKVGAAINAYSTETYSADTDGGMGMVFYTRPNNDGTDQDVTERMRITEAGSVCIGDDDPDYNGPRSALYVCSEHNNTGVSSNTYRPDIFVGASSTGGGAGAGGEIRFGARVYGTSGFAAIKGYISDGTANYNLGYLDVNMRASNTSASMTRRFRFYNSGDFHADGNVVAYSTSISDERFKDDVQPITGALDKVDALQGVTFTWNAGSREGQRDYGLIAQEVEKVLPEVVHESAMPLMTDDDNDTLYKTIDYDKLVSVLINAVSELRAEVEALKNGASE